MKNFWESFGKLALVLSVIFGVISAYDFFSKNQPEISFAAGYSSFTWPSYPDNPYGFIKEDEFDAIKASLQTIRKHSKFKSSLNVGIHNTGDKEAKIIRMKAPFIHSYQLSREGLELEVNHYKDVITINDIQPDESIYIIAWSDKELTDRHMDSIKLTHSDGFSDKTIYVKVESHWKKISQYWDISLVVLCGVLGLCLVYIGFYRNREQNA